jgi:L-2,4-diaminobutyrate decarboxylase
LPRDLEHSALVLTAGTTNTGVVDALGVAGCAAWTHVDAAWAGPLRLSHSHASLLAGIEEADSVAVSAHKWLFQPKESALVFFKDALRAHDAITFGGPYLATPNIGVLGSHGATAIPLLATLLAWGRRGMAERIECCMAKASTLADFISRDNRLELLMEPVTGVVVWRPRNGRLTEQLHSALPAGSASVTSLAGGRWLRNVAANPNADTEVLASQIEGALKAIDAA